jgi:hypothetical protein
MNPSPEQSSCAFGLGKAAAGFAAETGAHTRVKPKQALRRRAMPTLPRRLAEGHGRARTSTDERGRARTGTDEHGSLARGGRLGRWLEPSRTFTNGARTRRSGWKGIGRQREGADCFHLI